jgi:hypothetical protein
LIRELDEQLQQIGRHQRREGTPSEFFWIFMGLEFFGFVKGNRNS